MHTHTHTPTTLDDGSEAEVAGWADTMDHKYQMIYLLWFTWDTRHTNSKMTISCMFSLTDKKREHGTGVQQAHVPSGISTTMFPTPLLTVRGRVCSEGVEAHSSCNAIGWYCMISWREGGVGNGQVKQEVPGDAEETGYRGERSREVSPWGCAG